MCVNEFERDPDGNCVALRMPFYSSEDLMAFSEGFDGKCWSSYWNLWILNAVFGISEHIYWLDLFWFWNFREDYFFSSHFLPEALMQSDTEFNIKLYQLMHSLGIKPIALVLQHNSQFALYLNSDASKLKFVQNWNWWSWKCWPI